MIKNAEYKATKEKNIVYESPLRMNLRKHRRIKVNNL